MFNFLSVTCRGSWMPGPTRFLDCPQIKKFLSIHNLSQKFLTIFLVVSPNFTLISISFLQFIYKKSDDLNILKQTFSHAPTYPGCPGPSLFSLIFQHF